MFVPGKIFRADSKLLAMSLVQFFKYLDEALCRLFPGEFVGNTCPRRRQSVTRRFNGLAYKVRRGFFIGLPPIRAIEKLSYEALAPVKICWNSLRGYHLSDRLIEVSGIRAVFGGDEM